MSLSRYAVAAALAFSPIPPLYGQSDASPSDTADVLIVDHDFAGLGEWVRVFLQEGLVYRAELNSPDARLEIRGAIRNTVPVRVYPRLASATPSGSTILELHPAQDAEYEIRSVALGSARLGTRLRLYRDVSASERRQVVRAGSGWATGVEVAGGWHSGFAQSSGALSGSAPQRGSDLEGCLTARAGRGLSRFGLCAVGIGYQSGAPGILWIYTEPRFRILGHPAGNSWELGALFRLGHGMISASNVTPFALGPGVYLARTIRKGPSASGWTLQASYHRYLYKGLPDPVGSESETPKSHRFSFGVGWYR